MLQTKLRSRRATVIRFPAIETPLQYSRIYALHKLRAFVDFAVKNMRRDFEADGYEPDLAI